jgi:hypothetical protein
LDSFLPLATQSSALQHRSVDILSIRTSSSRCDTCDLPQKTPDPQKTPHRLEPTSPIRRNSHGVRRSTHALVSKTFFPPALLLDLAITLTFALPRVVTPAITRLGTTTRPTSSFAQPASHAYTRGTSLPTHERARATTVQRVLGKTTMTRSVNMDVTRPVVLASVSVSPRIVPRPDPYPYRWLTIHLGLVVAVGTSTGLAFTIPVHPAR